MKKVYVVEKDTKICKGLALSEGDTFVKTNLGWLLVEAEDDEEKKDDEDKDEMKEEEDSDEEEKDDEEKKEESKK
jgi:hypothetical protein